jgi:hypothetical protein
LLAAESTGRLVGEEHLETVVVLDSSLGHLAGEDAGGTVGYGTCAAKRAKPKGKEREREPSAGLPGKGDRARARERERERKGGAILFFSGDLLT